MRLFSCFFTFLILACNNAPIYIIQSYQKECTMSFEYYGEQAAFNNAKIIVPDSVNSIYFATDNYNNLKILNLLFFGVNSKLNTLKVRSCLLDSLSIDFSRFASIENLDLAECCLRDSVLLQSCNSLSHLKILNLERNQLTKIPYLVYSCPNLEVLILHNTNLKSLEVDLSKLPKLETIDIRNVFDEEIEKEIIGRYPSIEFITTK